jgi:competence ComEA-like helix-hairpin-helix protein
MRRPGLSGRRALALMGALTLLFLLLPLASALGFFAGSSPVHAERSAAREALFSGEEGEAALELLPGEKLDLNRATAEELEILPGIGPVLAEAIVSYRQTHGPFASVEDLLSVPGIGEGRLAAIRDLVEIGETLP